MLSCKSDFVTSQTVAQAPLSMEWLSFPSPGNLPYPRLEPKSPVSPALTSGFFTLDHLGSPNSSYYKLNFPWLFIY